MMLRFVLVAALLAAACKADDAPSSARPSGPEASNGAAPAGPQAIAHGAAPGAAAQKAEPRPLPKLADGRVGLGPFSALVPRGWAEKPSASSMRTAEFQVPASDGGDAEVIVYYFGENGAGSVQDNIDRWLSQFKQPDGKPSSEVAKIETAQFAGHEANLVSVSGRYVAPATPGGAPSDKPDQALVAAIVQSPRGPYYFRLIGAQAAVAANTARFRELLSSLALR